MSTLLLLKQDKYLNLDGVDGQNGKDKADQQHVVLTLRKASL